MIDLETLSTRTTASIVSIGAVKFDPYGDDPDAVLQNLVVGFLGYWTPDGLSDLDMVLKG